MAMSGVNLGTAFVDMQVDTSGLERGIEEAKNKVQGLSTSIGNAFNSVGTAFQNVGRNLTVGITTPLAIAARDVVRTGAEFDVSMAKVKAVAKSTSEEFEVLRKRAMEMGEKTRYTASEVADAMYYMGLAGWNTEQIYKGIPGVLNLAAASGEDLATVSDIVTDSLTAFGMTADDVDGFVNVLAETMRSSNTDVGKLGETFKYVAPVAGAYGYTIEDVALASGLFANAGVKASQAGTGLRQALSNLTKASGPTKEAMEKYGVSLFTSTGETKSLLQFTEELRGKFGKLDISIVDTNGEMLEGEEVMEKYGNSLPTSQMESLNAIVTLFGVRALPGMLALINATDEDFKDLKKSIYGAQGAYDGLGTAMGMAEEMMDNLQGDWYKFTSALGTTKIILSDLVKNELRTLLQNLTELVKAFNALDPETQKFILKMAAIAAAVGPVLIVLGTLLKSVGSIFTGFSTLVGIIAGGTGSVVHAFGLLGGAGGGIIGTVARVIGTFVSGSLKVLGNGLIDIINAFSKTHDAGYKLINIFTSIIPGAIRTLGSHIGTFISTHLGGLSRAFQTVGNFISNTFNLSLGSLGTMFGRIGSILTSPGGLIAILALLVAGFIKAYQSSETVRNACASLIDVFLKVVEVIGTLVYSIGKALMPIVNVLIDLVASVVKAILPPLVQTLEFIADILKRLAVILSPIITLIGELISIALKPLCVVLEFVANAIGKVLEVINKVLEPLDKFLQGASTKIRDFFKGAAEDTSKGIAKIEDTVMPFYSDTEEELKFSLGNMTDNIKSFGNGAVRTAFDTAQGFYTNIKDGVTPVTDVFKSVTSESSGILGAFQNDAQDKGDKTSRYYAEAIDSHSNEPVTIWNEVTGKSGTVLEGFKDKATQEGHQTGAGYTQGVDSETAKLTSALEKNTQAVMRVATAFEQMFKLTAQETGEEFREGVDESVSEVPNDTEQTMNAAVQAVRNKQGELGNAGDSAFGALESSVKKRTGSILEGVYSFARHIGESLNNVTNAMYGINVNGFHKGGLDYVPFDGYVASLHEGERVLTKQEAQSYNEGSGNGGGDTYNFYNTKPDPYEYARQMKRVKKEIAFG